MGLYSSALRAILITLGIVAAVLLFIALAILLGWSVWNAQFDRLLAVVGALNIPLWGATVIFWKWLLDRNRRDD